jgi:hypothetical protein
VGGGIFPKEESARDEADFIPEGVTWIQEAATSIDPEHRTRAHGRERPDHLRPARRGRRHPAWLEPAW